MYLNNVQVLFLKYFSNSDKFHPNFVIKVDNFANQNTKKHDISIT